jgi:hypothetical protein
MSSIEIKNFATDSDVSTPNNARVETVNIAGQKTYSLSLEPKVVRLST